MIQRSLKILDQALTPFHPCIGAFNNPSSCDWYKSNFTLGGFLGFGRFGCELKFELGHHLRVVLLQGSADSIWMIAVVKQDGNLGNVNGLGSKVVEIVAGQFNQSLIVAHVGWSAVREKW